MRFQYRGGTNEDVDCLHNLDPILPVRTPEIETSAIQDTPEYLPSAHVEGDVEELGDLPPGADAEVPWCLTHNCNDGG